MYQINDFISYGSRGVCKIVDIILRDDIAENHQARYYYCLMPLAHSWNTIYTPVDNDKAFRPLVSREEALLILDELPDIEALPPMNRFQMEQQYKKMMQENNPRDLIRLIKRLRMTRMERIAMNKKVNSSIQKYLQEARFRLIDTLSIPLEEEAIQVEQIVNTYFA